MNDCNNIPQFCVNSNYIQTKSISKVYNAVKAWVLDKMELRSFGLICKIVLVCLLLTVFAWQSWDTLEKWKDGKTSVQVVQSIRYVMGHTVCIH